MYRSEPAPFLRPRAVLPAPRLGILGGGQLAKMIAGAAATLGCETVIVERQADFPARSIATRCLIGEADDPRILNELLSLVDVVTMENEFVAESTLNRLAAAGLPVWPTAATMAAVQDKWRQKTTLAEHGLPTVRFAKAPTPEAVRAFGFPAVLKRRRHGYDGKGNATVRDERDLAAAWARLDGDREPLYVEAWCDFVRELAVIVTRGRDGVTVRYPVAETVNREHICHVVTVPAAGPPPLLTAAADLSEQAVTAVGGVGSFGVELFVDAAGGLWINELAPRVHNTGHYTIEACACSQFENHARAALGWPLGSPALRAPAAAMVNLLGFGDGSGAPSGLAEALALPGAHLHIYGKTRSARGRKMGHVTALGATVDDARRLAQRAADSLRFGS